MSAQSSVTAPFPGLLVTLFLTVSATSFACTQDEAIESMRAMSQAQTERLRGSPAQQQVAAKMAVQVAQVGPLLAESRFDEACDRYAAIASDFGIDIEAYKAQLAPLGAAAPGGCDVAAASRKINGAYAQYRDNVDTSAMAPRERQALHQRFSQSLDEATKYVQTDPQKACGMVDQTLQEFGAN